MHYITSILTHKFIAYYYSLALEQANVKYYLAAISLPFFKYYFAVLIYLFFFFSALFDCYLNILDCNLSSNIVSIKSIFFGSIF